MPYPIVRFFELVRQLIDKQNIAVNHTDVAILMEIASREKEGQPTKVTDLVKCWRFGTAPTVHRHLENLVQLKLVCKVKPDTDLRSFDIQLSNAGDALLKSLSTLMKKALK